MKLFKKLGILIASFAMGVGAVAGANAKSYSTKAEEATMTAGNNASSCIVNETAGVKVGTSKNSGSMSIKVGNGAKFLEFYAAAWKGSTNVSLNINPAANINPSSITLASDNGVANNSPFTLDGDEENYKFTFSLSGINSDTTFTFSGNGRYVVWGATYETSSGSGSSVEDSSSESSSSESSSNPSSELEESGDISGVPSDTSVYDLIDLSIDSTSSADAEHLSWTTDHSSVIVTKSEATTNADNYYPGTSGKSYTSTRFYKNSVLSSTINDSYADSLVISKLVFTATTSNYADELAKSTWDNSNVVVNNLLVYIVPNSKTVNLSCTIGNNCGFTSLVIYYDNNVKTALESPTSLTYDEINRKLTWNPVNNAAGYEVTIVGDDFNSSKTVSTCEFDVSMLEQGNYSATVKACAASNDMEHMDSQISSPIKFEIIKTIVEQIQSLKTEGKLSYDYNDVDVDSATDYIDFPYLFEDVSSGTNPTVTSQKSNNNLFTFECSKESGSNPPSYNSTDDDFRIYAKNKFTISSTDYKIEKISFTTTPLGNKTKIDFDVSSGAFVNPDVAYGSTSEAIWTCSEPTKSVTFTAGDTGQFRFTYILVTFASGTSKGFENVKLYFGKTMPLSKINSLKESGYSITAFGVIAMPKSVIGSEPTLMSYLNNNASIESCYIAEASGDLTNNPEYITNASSVKTAGGEYCSWYAGLNIPTSSLFKTPIVAVAYIKTESQTIYLQENEFSVKTIVDAYITAGYAASTPSLVDFQTYIANH